MNKYILLLLLIFASCSTVEKYSSLQPGSDGAKFDAHVDRQSTFTYRNGYISYVDGKQVKTKSNKLLFDHDLYVEPGKRELTVTVLYPNGLSMSGLRTISHVFSLEVRSYGEYCVVVEDKENETFFWIEDKKTGTPVTEKISDRQAASRETAEVISM